MEAAVVKAGDIIREVKRAATLQRGISRSLSQNAAEATPGVFRSPQEKTP
jgi:hypothetical protein